MLKKFLLVVVTFIASISFAFAQVDANKADQAALDGIKGIGPKMSQRILDERTKGGAFKDWNDLQSRVKGIKEKSAVRLSGAGLTVNGLPKNAPVTSAAAPAAAAAPTLVAAPVPAAASPSRVEPAKPSGKKASGAIQPAPAGKIKKDDAKK